MDIGKILYLALQGFILGYGPCLISCAPIVMPYVGTKKSWQDALISILSFSFGRLIVYVILGSIFGYFGAFLLQFYYSSRIYLFTQMIMALFIIFIGILIIRGKELHFRVCGRGEGNMLILGILAGMAPCLPLIGILMEIALISDTMIKGFIYSLAFGIGTIFSPLLVIGAIAPIIGTSFNNRLYKPFTYICGVLLIIVGLYIILIGRIGPRLISPGPV